MRAARNLRALLHAEDVGAGSIANALRICGSAVVAGATLPREVEYFGAGAVGAGAVGHGSAAPTYDADENSDGTWNIRRVPVFSDHVDDRYEDIVGPIDFSGAWLVAALQRAQLRETQDGYLPPLHLQHHSRGASRAGHWRAVEVAPFTYEGVQLETLFVDLIAVDTWTYEQIRRGEMPYVSVEVQPEHFDLTSAEVDSIALLSDDTPFFRYPLLRIGNETRHPNSTLRDRGMPEWQPPPPPPPAPPARYLGDHAARSVFLRDSGHGPRRASKALAGRLEYSAAGAVMLAPRGVAALFNFHPRLEASAMDPTKIVPPTPPKAENDASGGLPMKKPGDGSPAIGGDQLGTDKLGRLVDLMEAQGTILAAMAKKMGLGGEEQPAEAATYSAGEDEDAKKKASADRAGSVPAVAAAAAVPGAPVLENAALRGELRATNARIAAIEKERITERLTGWAKKELAGIALGSEAEFDREVREFAASGETTLKAYVAALKKRAAQRPMPMEASAGAAPPALEGATSEAPAKKTGDLPEVLAYSAHGPKALELARSIAEDYRASTPQLRGGKTLRQYLALQRELDEFPVTADGAK